MEASTRDRNLICVVGPVGSGKTTYIDRNFDPEESVIIRPGRFIRESAGVGFMMNDPYPNAPASAWWIVENLVHTGMKLSRILGRDMILDGMPRNVNQLAYLRACHRSYGFDLIVLHSVYPAIPEYSRRFEMRSRQKGKEFDHIRRTGSMSDYVEVVNEAMKMEIEVEYHEGIAGKVP